MKESGCPTAWASLTFGNRIMNKYGVRRKGLNLPVLVLLKQFRDGSGQGTPVKNGAGHTIRLSLNLWYHFYGNRMGNKKNSTGALLSSSSLTPLTAGISRPAARTLTYGSNESVRVEKPVQVYGMHNTPAGGPLFSHGVGDLSRSRTPASTLQVVGGVPGQVLDKNLLRNVRLLQKKRESTPPPLTGGGWGVGEDATCGHYGAFPPTLTLPRRGGGNIFDFWKSLNLPAAPARPISFFRRQPDRSAMPTIPVPFHVLRREAWHAATITNDRLPGAAPLPAIRLAPVTVDISRPVVDVLVGTKHETGRVEKTLQPHRMRNVSTDFHPFSQGDRDTAFVSLPMTTSPEFGALQDQAWGKNPLPGLTSEAARFSTRSHRQVEQIAIPVMQAPQQLFRKGVRQSRMTTNDTAQNAVSSLAGRTFPRFLKSQDVHVFHTGINEQMNALDAAYHSTEAENFPVSGRSGSYERTKHSVDKAFLGSAGKLRHPLQSVRGYGGGALPAIRLMPVTTGMSGPIAEDWTSTTGGDGKDAVAVQLYGRRNTRAGDALFTREGANLLQGKLPPTSPQTSIPSSGKTWDETSPLVHKRGGFIPGAEKSPSSGTIRAGNSSASPGPALVMDETIVSGAHRKGTGDGISVSEDFTDAKGMTSSGRQAAIPAAELKRVADSVYKMVEKRIMIERERRGM